MNCNEKVHNDIIRELTKLRKIAAFTLCIVFIHYNQTPQQFSCLCVRVCICMCACVRVCMRGLDICISQSVCVMHPSQHLLQDY